MKAWPDRVREHVETWRKRLPAHDWWPRFVYHFTDITNAVSILDEGKLYSRAEANRRGLLRTDVAAPDVIGQTAASYLEYVRLYFRPRTPTQFRNEGIRPRGDRWAGALCPVPVFLCFDTVHVLCRGDTELSDGNMASAHVQHAPAQEIFERIPFDHVFHDGPFSKQDGSITFHRCAEVLVPKVLGLAPSLKMIVCRSPAERTTLLHLLSEPARRRWAPVVRIDYQALFERRWTFVESIATTGTSIEFRFNPSTQTPGPFQVRFEYREAGSRPRIWTGHKDELNVSASFGVAGATHGEARLLLDDCMAFAGDITFEDAPF